MSEGLDAGDDKLFIYFLLNCRLDLSCMISINSLFLSDFIRKNFDARGRSSER